MYAQAYNALNGLLPYRPGTGMIITGQSSLVVQHVTTAAVCVVSVQKHDQTGHAVQTDNSEQAAGTGSDRSGKTLLPYVTFYAHLSLFVKQPRPLNVVSRRGTSRDRFFQISWSGPSSPSVFAHTDSSKSFGHIESRFRTRAVPQAATCHRAQRTAQAYLSSLLSLPGCTVVSTHLLCARGHLCPPVANPTDDRHPYNINYQH